MSDNISLARQLFAISTRKNINELKNFYYSYKHMIFRLILEFKQLKDNLDLQDVIFKHCYVNYDSSIYELLKHYVSIKSSRMLNHITKLIIDRKIMEHCLFMEISSSRNHITRLVKNLDLNSYYDNRTKDKKEFIDKCWKHNCRELNILLFCKFGIYPDGFPVIIDANSLKDPTMRDNINFLLKQYLKNGDLTNVILSKISL